VTRLPYLSNLARLVFRPRWVFYFLPARLALPGRGSVIPVQYPPLYTIVALVLVPVPVPVPVSILTLPVVVLDPATPPLDRPSTTLYRAYRPCQNTCRVASARPRPIRPVCRACRPYLYILVRLIVRYA
jgi:hypothetical protein